MLRGHDARADLAATARVKPIARERELDVRAHAREQRQKAARQEVERWRAVVVGPAEDAHAAFARGGEQDRQHGLEHQRAAARGADVERVIACRELAGTERKLARGEPRAIDLRIADPRGGIDSREVLAPQAGRIAIRANVDDAKRLLRADRERQRGAQDLTTALALGSVDLDHRDALN
jgi:hypothetical protein